MSGEIERVRDDIEGWFKDRGLAWNERIKVALMEYGVEFTEHLKVLPKDEWMALFSDQPLVPKKLAEIFFQHLKGRSLFPSNVLPVTLLNVIATRALRPMVHMLSQAVLCKKILVLSN